LDALTLISLLHYQEKLPVHQLSPSKEHTNITECGWKIQITCYNYEN